MAKDRKLALRNATTLNGIDFIEIASVNQTVLRVHFVNPVPVAGTISDVRIYGGDKIPEVSVMPIDDATDWGVDLDGNQLLTLRVPAPGDFSFYTLELDSPVLDVYFRRARFSFKALCDSPLDCQAPEPECPGAETVPVPIDYLAKDYASFRQTLLEFAALRYPNWVERSEADFGMMFLEALSALADELSYTQDRHAAEASLETATQQRSRVRHARLVDYEPRPAIASSVWLSMQMAIDGLIPAGLPLSVALPDGSTIAFEVGTGVHDTSSYAGRVAWNALTPYYFDDSQRCLHAGATEFWVEGAGLQLQAGQLLLIDTVGATSAEPSVRQIVRLADPPAVEEIDALFGNTAVTHIFLQPEAALAADHDLTRTAVRGNLVPATQGWRYTASFAIEPVPDPAIPAAVERTGPNGTTSYLYTLVNAPLAWLTPAGASLPAPEIRVTEVRPGDAPRVWTWFRKLLDASPFDLAYTLDALRYARVAINSDSSVSMDYDGDQGDIIRFGDGAFGNPPEAGTQFDVVYRVGGGAAGNIAPDAQWRLATPSSVISALNPFAATGGADAETAISIRRNAPEAFRAVQYRAVVHTDYEAAAQTLPWVQRAGSAFRYTGSWLTVFTTPDPKNSQTLGRDQQLELVRLLNRYRLAGYESYVPVPRYTPIDLRVTVCARQDAFRGDVYQAVLEVLSTRRFVDGSTGFFHFDNFTFGTSLERSALEAAIQQAHGVAGVLSILYRRRGSTPGYIDLPSVLHVAVDQILILENNPNRPERGSLQVYVEGGK